MRKRRIVAFVMCAVMQMCPVITMADDVAQTQETMSAEGTSAKKCKNRTGSTDTSDTAGYYCRCCDCSGYGDRIYPV